CHSDASLQPERIRAARNRADRSLFTADRRAVAGDGAIGSPEPHDAAPGARRLELRQGVTTDEVPLLKPHRPAQPGFVGVDGLVDVVPVEPEARLQPAD